MKRFEAVIHGNGNRHINGSGNADGKRNGQGYVPKPLVQEPAAAATLALTKL
jgi:hypothetical protein